MTYLAENTNAIEEESPHGDLLELIKDVDIDPNYLIGHITEFVAALQQNNQVTAREYILAESRRLRMELNRDRKINTAIVENNKFVDARRGGLKKVLKLCETFFRAQLKHDGTAFTPQERLTNPTQLPQPIEDDAHREEKQAYKT